MDYENLYKTYYMQVYSYTITLTRDREKAEELTQNAFYKAISSKSFFRNESDELTWLCAIAKNLYSDELRRNRKFSDFSEMMQFCPKCGADMRNMVEIDHVKEGAE